MGRQQDKPKDKRFRKNDIRLFTWNVLPLYRPGALKMLTEELEKYRAHITAIQEIRWIGEGILRKRNCDVYYSCHDRKHIFGIGFMVDRKIRHMVFAPVDERMCYLRVKGRFFNLSIINVHTLTENKEDAIKDEFYEELERLYDSRLKNDIKIIIGDFDTQIGREQIYRGCIGRHSIHENTHDNGSRLADFAMSSQMFTGSTKFEHRNIPNIT